MAKVAFGGGISNIQGSIGGNCFTRTKGGSAARNKVKPTNPSTPAQLAQRELITRLSKAWRTLTDAQRDAWAAAALTSKIKDKMGAVLELTGHQFYVKINTLRQRHSDSATASTPPSFAEFNTDEFDADSNNAVNIGTDTVTIGLGTGAAEGDKIEVSASAPRSAGVTASKGSMKSILAHTLEAGDITASAVNMTNSYKSVYGALEGTTDKVVTFSSQQYNEGMLSSPTIVRVTVEA
tara:strand:+ start:807 stop:1517 length:711 start_codon:yes stop_codon:yes gene_type:complete